MDLKKPINNKNIRVSSYTHERILKFSKYFKMNQGSFIESVLNIAEKQNFSSEVQTDILQKSMQKETNRLIGFIKTQDKKIDDFETRILAVLESKEVEKHQLDSDEYFAIFKEIFNKIYAKKLEKQGSSKEVIQKQIKIQNELFLYAHLQAQKLLKNMDNVR